MKKIFYSLLLVNTAMLTACASKLNTVSPENVDLSGEWVLNTTYSQEAIMPSPSRALGGRSGGIGGVRKGPDDPPEGKKRAQ